MHKALKCLSVIPQTKWHMQEFKKIIVVVVLGMSEGFTGIWVCLNQIYLGEGGSTQERGGKVLHIMDRVAVRHFNVVESEIITTWMSISQCLLGDHI